MHTFIDTYREIVGQPPQWQARRGIEDANIYVAEGGIPTITIGPGGQGAHEAGEFVRVSTLEPVATIYAETTARFLAKA